jgi:CDP-glucose 4,6-dehydratase
LITLFDNFYNGKRVLLTGHTGFKGTWLALWLKELGADVVGYSLEPPTSPSLFEICRAGEVIETVTGDVNDLAGLKRVFEASKPEIVFHLAAQSLVTRSYGEPVLTFATNVMGTINVLEASRHSDSVRAVSITTSDKCYEDRGLERGYRESDRLGGHDPYSSSKACAEIASMAYQKSYFNPDSFAEHRKSVCTVRAGNVIGGGDWAEDRIVPDCVRSLADHKTIAVRNPLYVRPWQFVLEPLGGYLSLVRAMCTGGPDYSGPWNFGPSDEGAIAVRDLADKIVALWGDGRWKNLSGSADDAAREAEYLKLDISKARNSLGWGPVLKLDEALKLTVEWYKRYYSSRTDMRTFTIEQIRKYCDSALKT